MGFDLIFYSVLLGLETSHLFAKVVYSFTVINVLYSQRNIIFKALYHFALFKLTSLFSTHPNLIFSIP